MNSSVLRIVAVAIVMACSACASAPAALDEIPTADQSARMTRVISVKRQQGAPLQIHVAPEFRSNEDSTGASDPSIGLSARVQF